MKIVKTAAAALAALEVSRGQGHAEMKSGCGGRSQNRLRRKITREWEFEDNNVNRGDRCRLCVHREHVKHGKSFVVAPDSGAEARSSPLIAKRRTIYRGFVYLSRRFRHTKAARPPA
mmetsp:Transcript_31942/g.76275  ORF Transcript_31942/g.76275 Transcript_31942/m.76275 type:complete len:117 (+) Transcript_31942:60-410(+)